MLTLKAGELAYFDSFSGLIPCKVLSIKGESGRANSTQEVTFQITASLGPYKRGELMRSNALRVVPRDAIKWRKHGVTIRPYSVECSMQ
jgi:hypothetical protein